MNNLNEVGDFDNWSNNKLNKDWFGTWINNTLGQYAPEQINENDLKNFYSSEIVTDNPHIPIIDIKVHPSDNNIVVINYPWAMWDIDWYAGKYTKLAAYMQKNIWSVVRISWSEDVDGYDAYISCVSDKLRQTIKYVMESDIWGNWDKQIYLLWFSAWGSGAAAVASEFPSIKKILLMAPSWDAWQENVVKWLSQYEWELYTINWEYDEVVWSQSWKKFSGYAANASSVKSVIIPDCNHQFMWFTNWKIMSSAPIRAFIDNNVIKTLETPDPKYWIKLYD